MKAACFIACVPLLLAACAKNAGPPAALPAPSCGVGAARSGPDGQNCGPGDHIFLSGGCEAERLGVIVVDAKGKAQRVGGPKLTCAVVNTPLYGSDNALRAAAPGEITIHAVGGPNVIDDATLNRVAQGKDPPAGFSTRWWRLKRSHTEP